MFALPEHMTLVEVPTLTVKLRDVIRHGQDETVVVMAGGLKHFDSSALAFLLEGRREALRHKRSLVIDDAPAKLVVLADLYGVRDLLGLTTLET